MSTGFNSIYLILATCSKRQRKTTTKQPHFVLLNSLNSEPFQIIIYFKIICLFFFFLELQKIIYFNI